MSSNTESETTRADGTDAPHDLLRLFGYTNERSPLPTAATEGETHIVRYANPAFCRLTHRESDEIIGRPIVEVVPNGEENGVVTLLDHVYVTREPEALENWEFHTSEGKSGYWSSSAWALLDKEQRAAGMILQITDTTEEMLARRRAEKEDAEIRAADELIRDANLQLLAAGIREHELAELAAATDPRTELPWPGSLRVWAMDQLARGREIGFLFIDIDDFGKFNKVYGHVVGDDVLQDVARSLVTATDPEKDFLCRYGGDEFCIATLRPAEEASELGRRIARRISAIYIPEIVDTPVTCSIGRSGGHRREERTDVHCMATINDLINLASKDCTAHKPKRPAPQAQFQPFGQRNGEIESRSGDMVKELNSLLTIITGLTEQVIRLSPPSDIVQRYLHNVKSAADIAAMITSQMLAPDQE